MLIFIICARIQKCCERQIPCAVAIFGDLILLFIICVLKINLRNGPILSTVFPTTSDNETGIVCIHYGPVACQTLHRLLT